VSTTSLQIEPKTRPAAVPVAAAVPADPAPPPRHYESPRFWPERDRHVVATMRLEDPAQSGLSPAAVEALRQATQLSETLRNAEDVGHDADPARDGLVSFLRAQTAAALDRAAAQLSCPGSARSLQLRAAILRGAEPRAIQRELVDLDENELFSVCGPLGTWLGKSRTTYHSGLFALVDRPLNAVIAAVDTRTAETEAFLRDLVDPRLELQSPPAIKFTRLMFCGGEANLYPKHFAYFLPEDEGIKHAPRKKTLVLVNVYREMYRRVSEPFSRHVVADPVEGDPDAIDLQLTLWFRGHDTGHGVRLPETDFTAMRCEGRWLSMVMQEAMADVFGFLMSTAGPWTEVAPTADRGVAATIFLREMLRYLCRGGDDFPDAGAALIELSFLAAHGYVDLDTSAGPRLATTPDRLFDGLVALARLFARTALANDRDGMRGLLDRYYRNGARDFVAACGVCDLVLDYAQDLSPQTEAA